MEQSDFDELLSQARQVGQLLKTAYSEVTGEDLDVESAMRHYPVLALALAAGAGAAAGWWFGSRKQRALPPPRPALPQLETQEPVVEASAPGAKRSRYFEQLFPAVERMRNAVPDEMADEAAQAARTWMDTVLEPKLKKGLDSVTANVSESRFGTMLRQAMQGADATEEVRLEDPPESERDVQGA